MNTGYEGSIFYSTAAGTTITMTSNTVYGDTVYNYTASLGNLTG